MEWLHCINQSIRYMEDHMTDELSVEMVSAQAFLSHSNFQRVFHLVTGITVGEYIRNRRLSLAGRDLLLLDCRVTDIAMKYQYDTSESFSKAFSRFHGIAPSDVKKQGARLKFFYPLAINISIQGGFQMTHKFTGDFCWSDVEERQGRTLTAPNRYQRLVEWAGRARGQNPGVFDDLTEWLLDDEEWGAEKLAENEQILIQGVFSRFREQNARLRTHLTELKPSGVVNEAVFRALDRFDEALLGNVPDKALQSAAAQMFRDFSAMGQRKIRERIGGSKTGPTGTDHADIYGFINYLKDCDAQVQWALFMPEMVKRQQAGFWVEHFSIRKMPALRFIGQEADRLAGEEACSELFKGLDAMEDMQSEFGHDLLLTHHYGESVDTGSCHAFWGRFMRADAPVPKGLVSFDFVPWHDGNKGLPYLSRFAFAAFAGDTGAMHSREGYDCSAMYDVTRNILLSRGIHIPYPDKYWTAEVFPDGWEKDSTAYLFAISEEKEE